MVTSFFRRSPTTPSIDSKTGVGNIVQPPSLNLFTNGTLFDLYLYACENKLEPDYNEHTQLLWLKRNLIYGDWTSGPTGDGIYTTEVTIPLSEVSRKYMNMLIINK